MAEAAIIMNSDQDTSVMEISDQCASNLEHAVRVVPYALDQNKLVNNLVTAASSDLPDLAMTVNDNGSNVNLQCSPAYFLSVAKPALSSVNSGFTRVSDGFSFSMSSPPSNTVDSLNLQQTSLLKFNIYTHTQAPTEVGSVSIHLHFTKTKIQVQGGTKMPDHRPAAVWFTQCVLIPLLEAKSRSTKFGPAKAKSLHQSILAALSGKTRPTSSAASVQVPGRPVCAMCKGPFRKNALANPCNKLGFGHFFHKQDKCMKAHDCAPKAPCTPATVSSKRKVCDVTDLRTPESRQARIRLNSNESSEDEDITVLPPPASTGQFVLRPSLLSSLTSTNLPSGQAQLQSYLTYLQGHQEGQLAVEGPLSNQQPAPQTGVSPCLSQQPLLQPLQGAPPLLSLQGVSLQPPQGAHPPVEEILSHQQPAPQSGSSPPFGQQPSLQLLKSIPTILQGVSLQPVHQAVEVLQSLQQPAPQPGASPPLGQQPPVQLLQNVPSLQIFQGASQLTSSTAEAQAPTARPARQPRQNSPQLTPDGLQIELLNREITIAKTKIAGLDNTVTELNASNGILLERIRLFEQRENDTQFAQYFPTCPPGANSASHAPPVQESNHPAPPPASCCSPQVLAMMENMQCQIEDMRGALSLLLKSSPHPFPPPCAAQGPPTHAVVSNHPTVGGEVPTESAGFQAQPSLVVLSPPAPSAPTLYSLPPPPPSGYLQELLFLDLPLESLDNYIESEERREASRSEQSQGPPPAPPSVIPNQRPKTSRVRPRRKVISKPVAPFPAPRPLFPKSRPIVWLPQFRPPPSATGSLFLNDQSSLPSARSRSPWTGPHNAASGPDHPQTARTSTSSDATPPAQPPQPRSNARGRQRASPTSSIPQQTEALLIDLN